MNYRDEVFKYIKNKYKVEPEFPWKDDPISATFKDVNNQKWFALYMEVPRIKLSEKSDEIVGCLNVKAEPDFIAFIAGTKGFKPAYHMNKKHWITILLDGSADIDQIYDCIDRSYSLVADTPTSRIYEAVKKIPKGKVATYGQVAELAGDKKMARAVGNALHKNPDPDNIPCFRVVNAKGELAGEFAFGGSGAQTKLLEADGVKVEKGKVDLKAYGICVESILQNEKED